MDPINSTTWNNKGFALDNSKDKYQEAVEA